MNSQVAASEPALLTEVPDELKRLARYITRGFYSIEHALIMDILVRNAIVKEDDMAELLKFDKKQLRIFINRLKNDKLIKQTMRVETQPDGRTNRHNYYFINYKVFVDVVKYKLDKMRQKIENKERDSTCKTLFKCPQCLKEFNEFDAGNLMDMMTGLMHCTYCGAEVNEDESAVPKKDAYMQIAIFNEQMKPIFDLLKSVEHVKLSKTLLEPTPSASNENKRPSAGASKAGPGGAHNTWSGDSSRNLGFEMYDQQVTINVGQDTEKEPAAKAPARERPVWLMESTVEGAIAEEMQDPTAAAEAHKPAQSGAGKTAKTKESEEIIRALLAHERKSGHQAVLPTSDAESDASASDDDMIGASTSAPITHTVEMDSGEEDEEEEEEDVMVSVGGRIVPFQDITDDLVAQMTPTEKEAYIRLGQEAYAAMYD